MINKEQRILHVHLFIETQINTVKELDIPVSALGT